MTQRTCGP